MNIKYSKAKKEDADLLVEIYNASFYDDYIKYGECPAYGRSRENMEASIVNNPKLIIQYDNTPVGVLSVENRGEGEYYLGCLCVIPKYQGKGIGTLAFRHMLEYYADWKKITLVTPLDKEENIDFYTKKCGFRIDHTEIDRNVELAHFIMER